MGCCQPPPEPDFQSEEGRARRLHGLKLYGTIGKIQLPLSILAILSGATTIGLAIPNPKYPFLACFPLVNGCLLLAASICAIKASQQNVYSEVSTATKRFLGIAYGLIMSSNSSLGSLAVGMSGWALGLCASNDDRCTPNHDVKMAFVITDIVFNALLMPTVWVSLYVRYKYGRSYWADRKTGGCC